MASSKARAASGVRKLDSSDVVYIQLRDCLVRNLSLLGFNESTIAKRNGLSVERVCWPVLDQKQDLQFRKISIDFLKALTAEHNQICLPQNLTSLFLSPYGRKFYSFLVHLTNNVLAIKVKRMKGSDSNFLSMPKEPKTKEELGSISKLFELSTKMHLANFFKTEDEKLVMYQTFKKEIRDQEELNRDFHSKIEEKKKSILSKEERLAKYKLNLSADKSPLENTVSKLKTDMIESWKPVDSVCDHSKEHIESLNYFMGSYDKYKLDCSKLLTSMPPPSVDVRSTSSNSNGDLEGLTVDGNVRLEHFVDTFNKTLSVYISKLQQDFGCEKRDLGSVCSHRDRHNELLIPLLSIRSKLVPLSVALNSSSETLLQEAVSQLNSLTVDFETVAFTVSNELSGI